MKPSAGWDIADWLAAPTIVVDLDPHRSDKLDPDPHKFADDKPKWVWNMGLFEHFFKVFSLYLEARIRLRIHIKVKGRVRIRI
jgi:hypothetical protein